MARVGQNLNSRVELTSAFGMLERSAVKVACCVLRGAGAGNGPVPTRRRHAAVRRFSNVR